MYQIMKVGNMERTFNERTLGLNNMFKLAVKYYPELKLLIKKELEYEHDKIRDGIRYDKLLKLKRSILTTKENLY